tara:strand:+ start:104 stop:1108 length:1005 start_codon:yes stop_codon:yes gene_type:complete
MTYIKIPRNGVPPKLRAEIEAALPTPLEVPGWKFNGYVWRKLTQINKKDSQGFEDNSVRVSGTGDNEVLEESLKKGIDITKLTPSVYPNNNLLNGFNRHKRLVKVGYKEWIFAEYVKDESTATEFQSSDEEFVDDFRAAANKGDGTKVITSDEITELGRKRFQNRKRRSKDKIKDWIETLDLNLSAQKVAGIAKKISSDFERKGVIQSFDRKEAEEYLANLGIGADVLNTHGTEGDKTRVLRLLVVAMQNFVDNKSTLNVALFDSQATSHENIDDHRSNTIKTLKELDDLVMDYVSLRNLKQYRDIKPYEVLGALPQKIGDVTEVSDSLVKLPD